jgi:hypothetical protein
LVRFVLSEAPKETAMAKTIRKWGERGRGSRHGRQVLVALALVLAASCGKETQLEDLKSPVLLWTQTRANCGQSVAVDGNGDVWFEHGCESGPNFHKVGAVTEAQVAALRGKFDALPSGPPQTLVTCMGNLDVFSIVDSPVTTSTGACSTSSAVFDKVTALPPSFQAAASAMAALEPR